MAKNPHAVALGQKGGKARSAAKAAAARLNGKKGGRPRLMDHLWYFTRILAGYECAGADQESSDNTPCGTCGPCEADAFISQHTASRRR